MLEKFLFLVCLDILTHTKVYKYAQILTIVSVLDPFLCFSIILSIHYYLVILLNLLQDFTDFIIFNFSQALNDRCDSCKDPGSTKSAGIFSERSFRSFLAGIQKTKVVKNSAAKYYLTIICPLFQNEGVDFLLFQKRMRKVYFSQHGAKWGAVG